MKVLHVIPSVSPTQGGPSRAIVDMERALTARGLEVTTATTNDDGDARTLAVPCDTPIMAANATRWHFPRTTVFYKVSVGLGRWLSRNIGAFDVVHAHGLFSFAPIMAATLARRAGVPYVLRPLGVLDHYGMTQHHPTLKNISFRLMERRLIEAADAVHFTSRAEQLDAEALGLRCKSVVIPLGIAVGDVPARDAHRKAKGRVELLFLSRIDPKKNLEAVLQALALVARERSDIVLRIAGDGEAAYLQSLKALAADLGLAGRIEWLGYVDGARKDSVLADADAFVLASFSENFGIAVAEALARGVPAIVSRGVAIHEEIGEAKAGIVVDGAPNSIAAGIRRLLDGQENIAAMSAAARKLAEERFSLEIMGQRLEALYRAIRRDGPMAAAKAA